jgi:ABC-2 type transport system permease protein
MRELLIVLQREFVERVRTRSFIISTILTPLLLLLFGLGPSLVNRMRTGGEYRLAVVDETPHRLGGRVQEILAPAGEADPDNRFRIELLPGPAGDQRATLDARVTGDELDGYLVLPAGLASGDPADLRSRDAVPGSTRRQIAAAVSTAVQAERMQSAGIAPQQLGAILQPVKVNTIRLTATGEKAQSDAGLIFAILVGFFLYILILLFGPQVMQSVQEEKQNRIAEVLVSSVRAPQLMLGKVLGVGLAALLQVGIWAALATLIMTFRNQLMSFGLPEGLFTTLMSGANAGVLVSALLYLIFGFFLYATLFAAAGSAMASSEDAQRFTFPLIMPLVIPMIMADSIVSAPQDTVAVVLSWIPLTSPLVMPMRIGAGGASTVEIVGTIAELALSVVALGWVAGKVYRVGILSTGKRPTFGEMIRWIRMA